VVSPAMQMTIEKLYAEYDELDRQAAECAQMQNFMQNN
jgi:hypothetical protein